MRVLFFSHNVQSGIISAELAGQLCNVIRAQASLFLLHHLSACLPRGTIWLPSSSHLSCLSGGKKRMGKG